VRVLLVSTYDLGRQPFGLASPAAWLERAGAVVDCVDTSRERLIEERIAAADLVAFYLPMHTATRLAGPLIDRVRRANPGARLAAYGLYAPINEGWLREKGITDVLGPEGEQELVQLAANGSGSRESKASGSNESSAASAGTGRDLTLRPQRAGLLPLAKYAALRLADGSTRIAGSTDATRGCKHLCRHCPIVPVYRGTFRVVPVDDAGTPVGTPIIALAGADDAWAPSDDGFVRRFVARQYVRGCRAKNDCSNVTHYEAEALVQLRDALHPALRAR
jgi:hypothetical protein